jgi:hypothetical protein
MSDDYLWDRSGTAELDTKQLEELLAQLAHDAALDELRLAKGRRDELLRATAQEPGVALSASGRAKGKMNIFDKRIIGAATLTVVAIGLIGVTAYKRWGDAPVPDLPDEFKLPDEFHGHGPMVPLGRSFAMTPHASPVAPTTGADLAITAGESAWIHVPIGPVDVEIQSKCNAEVEMSLMTAVRFERGARPGDPPTASAARTGGLIAGTDSPDGKASTYHLTPGLDPGDGMYEYTSRCVGQPPIRGHLVIDCVDARGPIGYVTNARVYYDALPEHGTRLLGTVLPGARVTIDAKPLAVEPDPTWDNLPIYSKFATDVRVSPDHLVAAVRVDDVKGTHFYVIHFSGLKLVESCATTMTAPKQAAGKLDALGDDVGALKALETAMTACKPDRDTLALALTYACKAGDTEAARNYWRKLPPELQGTIEPVCARSQITRDALDR